MKKYLFIAFSLLSFNLVIAQQQDFTINYMEFVPQRRYNNPAFVPFSKVFVGLPGISSAYLYAGNSGFKYNDLIQQTDDDSLQINMDNFIDQLKDQNYLSVGAHTDLLSFGFRVKQKNYFTFNATERVYGTFTYPKDFFVLLWEGNGKSLLGERASFDGFGVDFMHYREYGLGYSREINDKLVVGGKLKYLYGLENIWTEESQLGLTTDSEGIYELTLDGKFKVNTAGIYQFTDTTSNYELEPAEYLFGRKNTGYGIDLGATYQFNDEIAFSASVIDLGQIKWQQYTRTIESNDFEVSFNGLDLYSIILAEQDTASEDSASSLISQFADSLAGQITSTTSEGAYKTWLPPKIHLGATYALGESHTFGALAYGTFLKGKLRPAMTLSYNYKLKRFLNLSASYSMYNRSYTNLGIGFSLNLAFLQWYLVTDNVLSTIVPQATKNVHIRTGINFTFGRREHDKDGDGIADKRDECPELEGIKDYDGCPDSDVDGIPDHKDDCPTVYGLEQFNGCPDTDGDGIGDLDDACIDVAGIEAFNGCPDTDGDSIPDSEDECPEKAGLAESFGCPDTDKDGIVDSRDECPEKAGVPENFGCPEVKLAILDENGEVVQTATKNKDGAFEFKNLPPDKHYLFRMEGEDIYMSDDLVVVFNNDGEETVVTAEKSPAGEFAYEYLPQESKELPLVAMDEDGNVIAKGYRNEKGQFVFENLPTDKHYLFQIEGQEDASLPEGIEILLKNEEQTFLMKLKKKKGEGGRFDYEFLPSESGAIELIQYEDEGQLVILEEAEQEVVDKAFEHLEFNTNSAVISYKSKESLNKLADLLNSHSSWRLNLKGYSDNTGSATYNLVLSKRRAEAVKRFLIDKGVPSKRINVKYFGEKDPVASNDTEEGRQQNRRVEMEIVD